MYDNQYKPNPNDDYNNEYNTLGFCPCKNNGCSNACTSVTAATTCMRSCSAKCALSCDSKLVF